MADLRSDGGKRVGGFPLGAKIRSGPVIAVFESQDETGRRVEISLFRGAALRDRISEEDFLAEAARTREIEHENLCALVTAGVEGEVWHAAAAIPDAPTLRDLLDRGGALAPERARAVALGVIAALAKLHESGLRHGDVRPDRIYLEEGRALLAPRTLVPLSPGDRDTRYLAPEETAGGEGDARSDLFSLGAVLIETLTGDPPAPAGSPEKAIESVRAGRPPELAEISPELAALVDSLYTERPGDRPNDATTVARALSGEISLTPTARPEVRIAAVKPIPKKRPTGRLRMALGGAPATWELLHDETFLGVDQSGRVSVSIEESGRDLARLLREPDGDVLFVVAEREPRIRVNGSLVDRHVLADGDVVRFGKREIAYETMKIEPARSDGAVRARREKRRAGVVALGTTTLCLLVVAWAAWRVDAEFGAGEEHLRAAVAAEARLLGEEESAPAPEVEVVDDAVREAARKAYEEVKAFAAEHPESFDRIRSRFMEVQQQFGRTEYGYLAMKQMEELSERRSEAHAKEYEEVVANAAICIEQDRLYQAYLLYHNFADDHPDSIDADRAAREARSIDEALEARFDEDMVRAEEAIRAGLLGKAVDVLKDMEIYATPDLRMEARAKMEKVQARLQETQVPGAANPEAPPAEPPDPDRPEDPGPADPEPGPSDPEPVDPAAARLEKQAADTYEDAARAMDRERWDDAVESFEKLLGERYADTRFVAENLAEIRRMLGLARLSKDGAAALFKGKVKVVRGREVIITYDWDSPEEESDWTFINPFADPGRSNFELRSAGYYAFGVGALVLNAVFEPDSLRIRAKVQAIKPTDFGLQLFEPEQMLRYYLFTVQNRYFTIGAERTPLHENVIWVFGGGAWSDNPDGNIGFVRKVTAKKPAVSAGETISLDVSKVGNNLTMSIKNSPPMRGSAMGDDRFVYPALQPALYVLQSEALFEHVEIHGVLQKRWAESAMARARKKLER